MHSDEYRSCVCAFVYVFVRVYSVSMTVNVYMHNSTLVPVLTQAHTYTRTHFAAYILNKKTTEQENNDEEEEEEEEYCHLIVHRWLTVAVCVHL